MNPNSPQYPNPVIDFSPRELQIIHLLMAGETNKEIAIELCIGVKTVEFHLGNIYSKMGVRTRTEAVVWALHHQIT
jgi:DNA-binding NarL/FixJ family response regulator